MKIIINEQAIDVISLTINENKLQIQTCDTQNIEEVMHLLITSGEITYLDNDGTVIRVIESGYSFQYVETRDGYHTFYVNLPPAPEEPRPDTLAILNEQLTNIELALCEIYESMGV